MTLERSFHELNFQLRVLYDDVQALRITIVEDRPQGGDVAVVDPFIDKCDDMLGWLKECIVTADESHTATAAGAELSVVWPLLIACQNDFQRVSDLYAKLVSYNMFAPLLRFGHQQGGEWYSWTTSVHQALDQLDPLLLNVRSKYQGCWEELIERVNYNEITIFNANIGHRVTVADRTSVAATS